MRCPNCSADLSVQDEKCPACNTLRPQLPPPFAEVRKSFLALLRSYHAGEIDKDTFESENRNLVVQGPAGASWWLGGEAGQWYRHDGQRWFAQDPPLAQEAKEQTHLAPEKEPKKSKFPWPLIAIPGAAALLCLCAGALVLSGAFPTLRESLFPGTVATEELQAGVEETAAAPPTSAAGPASPSIAIPSVPSSDDQQLIIDEFGWPDSFTILEADTEAGAQVRYEIWTYYQGRITFTFFDGVFQVEGDVESLPAGFIPTPHHPAQFPLGASPDQIEALLPNHTLVPQENFEAIGPGVQMYIAQQLVLGFLDDQLFYVDALAFIPEGSTQ